MRRVLRAALALLVLLAVLAPSAASAEVASVGNGGTYQAVAADAVPFATSVVADTQPVYPYAYGTYAVWLRGSVVAMPLCDNATADWLKAPNALRAYDEVIVSTLTATQIACLESVIPAIGSNDSVGPAPSRVLFYVAGNPNAPYVDRLLAAAAANPRVELGIEGYHQGLLYATYADVRAEERAWLAKLRARGFPMARAWYGISNADRPDYAGQNPAYDSATVLARDADEDAVAEWLAAGAQHVFVWSPYQSARSRWMAGDAVIRGIRRRYGVAP
jgi:hypothetical protein